METRVPLAIVICQCIEMDPVRLRKEFNLFGLFVHLALVSSRASQVLCQSHCLFRLKSHVNSKPTNPTYTHTPGNRKEER